MIEKIKKNYFLLIATFLLLYFFFNLLDGERGLISYFSKNSQLLELEKQEIRLYIIFIVKSLMNYQIDLC